MAVGGAGPNTCSRSIRRPRSRALTIRRGSAVCPTAVLTIHASDQRPNLRINLRTAANATRLPPPVGAETASVPADHGLRLDDDDRIQDRRIQSIQPNEQQAIDVPQSYAFWVLALRGEPLLSPIPNRTEEGQADTGCKSVGMVCARHLRRRTSAGAALARRWTKTRARFRRLPRELPTR